MKNVQLISARGLFVVVACAALLAAGGGVSAKPGASRYTPQQRAASTEAMRTGLADLQAASGAMQGGNAGQTAADLQSAISSMQQALPLYNGYRDSSVNVAAAALRQVNALQGPEKMGKRKPTPQQVEARISRAIQLAQVCLGIKGR